MPVWSRLLAVYVVSRLVTTAIMLAFAAAEPETWQSSARPGYFEFANLWDAEWYRWIGANGYPSELPVGDHGRVTENAWAFYPVYPFFVRALSAATTLPFEVCAVVVSLIFGYLTVVVYHRLIARTTDASTAMFAVVILCFGIWSPLFQVGYAESMEFFFVAALLLLLVERRWIAMLPVVVVASLTRTMGLAWALTLGLYWLWRMHRARRGAEGEPFPLGERMQVLLAGAVSVVAGFAWLLIAWWATGDPDAYVATELAWRIHYTGPVEMIPFTAWFHGGEFWFVGRLGMPGPLAGILVVVIVAAMYALLASPAVRRLGIEIQLWSLSFFTYIFAVFFPQSSTFRILMPLFPATAALARPRSFLYRSAVVVVCLVTQVLWILWMWYAFPGDWTPP